VLSSPQFYSLQHLVFLSKQDRWIFSSSFEFKKCIVDFTRKSLMIEILCTIHYLTHIGNIMDLDTKTTDEWSVFLFKLKSFLCATEDGRGQDEERSNRNCVEN